MNEIAKKLYEHIRIWQGGQRPQVVDHLNPSDIANLALFLTERGWNIAECTPYELRQRIEELEKQLAEADQVICALASHPLEEYGEWNPIRKAMERHQARRDKCTPSPS